MYTNSVDLQCQEDSSIYTFLDSKDDLNSSTKNIITLPLEICLQIFELFSAQQLCQVSSLSKTIKLLTEDNFLWEKLCIKFPIFPNFALLEYKSCLLSFPVSLLIELNTYQENEPFYNKSLHIINSNRIFKFDYCIATRSEIITKSNSDYKTSYRGFNVPNIFEGVWK